MFFRPIHFDNFLEITHKLQNLYQQFNLGECHDKNRPYSEIQTVCPELHAQFQAYGLIVEHAFIFQTLPKDQNPECGIHSDLDSLRDPNLVLNWPLFNCRDTMMNFYQVSESAVSSLKTHEAYQKSYRLFLTKDCTLIDGFELSKPYLIDANIPHNVTPSDGYRVIISFRFVDNPGYQTLSAELKNPSS